LNLLVAGLGEAIKSLLALAVLLIGIVYIVGILFTILVGQNDDPYLEHRGVYLITSLWFRAKFGKYRRIVFYLRHQHVESV